MTAAREARLRTTQRKMLRKVLGVGWRKVVTSKDEEEAEGEEEPEEMEG